MANRISVFRLFYSAGQGLFFGLDLDDIAKYTQVLGFYGSKWRCQEPRNLGNGFSEGGLSINRVRRMQNEFVTVNRPKSR